MAFKETSLGDDAEIYKERDNRSEREKFKSMPPKEKWKHFLEYYLKSVIALTVIGFFVVSLIITILRPKKETLLSVAAVNQCISEDTLNSFEEMMNKKLDVNPKKQEIVFDGNYMGSITSSGIFYCDRLLAAVTTSQLDVIIASEDEFATLTEATYFEKLSDVLPSQMFSNFTEHFFYGKTTADTQESAYGIYLSDYDILDESGNIIAKPILGVVANTENVDNIVTFIESLTIK